MLEDERQEITDQEYALKLAMLTSDPSYYFPFLFPGRAGTASPSADLDAALGSADGLQMEFVKGAGDEDQDEMMMVMERLMEIGSAQFDINDPDLRGML